MLDPPVSTEAELSPPAAPAEPAAAKSHAALPASWHLASGALSGAASVLMLQPLDREPGQRSFHCEILTLVCPVLSHQNPDSARPTTSLLDRYFFRNNKTRRTFIGRN